MFLLAHFEATLYLAAPNLLAHNNITINYVQVNSLPLKSSVASEWASKHVWGTIYFAVDGTYIFESKTSIYFKFRKFPLLKLVIIQK